MSESGLWDGEHLILLSLLVDAYHSTVKANGLWDKTQEPRPKPAPVGGISQEQTDEHFCHSFDGSVARIQLVYLDPKGSTTNASKTLRRFLSGGDLCLVDVPAGAGAAALSMLSAIAQLRSNGELPRQPLNVRLLGGEISVPALNYAKQMLDHCSLKLEEQDIFLTFDTITWNVLDDTSNQILVEKIAQAKSSHPQILLTVCNFSGFLERAGKWKEAEVGLNQLFKFCSGDMNAAVWIELNQNSVSNSLFKKIATLMGKLFKFGRLMAPEIESESAEARFKSPLVFGLCPRVRARVMPISLDRRFS